MINPPIAGPAVKPRLIANLTRVTDLVLFSCLNFLVTRAEWPLAVGPALQIAFPSAPSYLYCWSSTLDS